VPTVLLWLLTNTRPRAAEVMVDGDKAYLVREREKLAQLWQGEQLLP
jgi:diaminopimelate decarboxylase